MTEIIGLTGGMCSGKDSWADFFRDEFGFTHLSTSNIVREYISENGLGEPTRDLTRETATQLRSKHGSDYLMRKAIESASENERVVISGIYVVPEALRLKAEGGSIVNISTDEMLQFTRMSTRRRAGEYAEIDEFNRLIANDLHSSTTDQRLAEVVALADFEIDGSVPLENIARRRKIARDVLRRLRESTDV